jgi:hypothetical protein
MSGTARVLAAAAVWTLTQWGLASAQDGCRHCGPAGQTGVCEDCRAGGAGSGSRNDSGGFFGKLFGGGSGGANGHGAGHGSGHGSAHAGTGAAGGQPGNPRGLGNGLWSKRNGEGDEACQTYWFAYARELVPTCDRCCCRDAIGPCETPWGHHWCYGDGRCRCEDLFDQLPPSKQAELLRNPSLPLDLRARLAARIPKPGTYHMAYEANPGYFDARDGRVYAAKGYGTPVAMPLAPNVERTYNFGWGTPVSRLTPVWRNPQQLGP